MNTSKPVTAEEHQVGFTIQVRAKTKSGWRKLRDCSFLTAESAENYGVKYHTDRHGARMFRVAPIMPETFYGVLYNTTHRDY